MSFQIALMAGMVAMSAAQAASGAAKGASDLSAAGESRQQGDLVRKASGLAAAAQTDVDIAGTKLQTQQQELQRRRQIASLWQANAIDIVGRGGVSGDGGSADVIQDYNASLGEEDIANIRLMGESKVNKLSFRKNQQMLGVSAQDLDIANTQDFTSRQIGNLTQQAIFKIGGSAVSALAGSGFGGGSGGFAGSAGGQSYTGSEAGYHSYGD